MVDVGGVVHPGGFILTVFLSYHHHCDCCAFFSLFAAKSSLLNSLSKAWKPVLS